MQIENLEFFALNVLNLRHLYMNPSLVEASLKILQQL